MQYTYYNIYKYDLEKKPPIFAQIMSNPVVEMGF